MASEAGRELAYQHWDKDDLVRALMQAEGDLKVELRRARELEEALLGIQREHAERGRQVKEVKEERDRYYEESRDSADTLGKIILALRHGGIDLYGEDSAAPMGRPVRRSGTHFYRGGDAIGGAVCNCGLQWLAAANRCVGDR